MDKEEATKIANKLLEWYGKPEEEKWSGITAVLATYGGKNDVGPHTTLTKEAADKLLLQVLDKKLPVIVNGVPFVFKTAWMEDDNGKGRIMAEYVKAEW